MWEPNFKARYTRISSKMRVDVKESVDNTPLKNELTIKFDNKLDG